MHKALIVVLVVLAVGYIAVLVMGVRRTRRGVPEEHGSHEGHSLPDESGTAVRWLPTRLQTLIGFVTNFFDTLGIGNFAPTTAWYRFSKLVPDELIPGTMNVGHTLPVMLMAVIFIGIVEVEPVTLLSMLASAVVGAWFGAGVVSRLPKKRIQIGMGGALIVAGLLMAAFQFKPEPVNTGALGLEWPQLIVACIVIAMLGALMTIGVGLYAPCMILISLMGMNPIAAYPIMMGACAFLMPVASTRFVHTGKQRMRAALGLAIGGLPAVLIAAPLVNKLSVYWLKWLVVVVVLITAVQMLRAAFAPKPARQDSV